MNQEEFRKHVESVLAMSTDCLMGKLAQATYVSNLKICLGLMDALLNRNSEGWFVCDNVKCINCFSSYLVYRIIDGAKQYQCYDCGRVWWEQKT